MAVQLPIPVRFEDVFPAGAYVLGVEPINDFDQVRAGTGDPQQRDKVTGERLWAVRVLDADPESRKGQAEVAVKITAPVQPVPPEAAAGTPFRPVEFDGLALMPYVDTSKTRPRSAFSIRATGMRAPGRAGKTPSGTSASAPSAA
ncbi:MAG: plasmid replication, integration and excision activator [Actinomycetota bacterium]|nr:plasmid replication, integration and excision activator [Actinomycetota bacterium]